MKHPTITNTSFGVIAVAGACSLLTSCSDPEGDFKKAEQANTDQTYMEFIKKHSDSPLATQAKARIEKNAYEAARTAASIEAYEHFLKRFPQSDLAGEAASLLRKLQYEAAIEAPTLASYIRCLQKYPNGTDSDDLRKSLQTLPKWEESKRLGELILTLSPKTYISLPMSGITGSGNLGLGPASLTTEKPTGQNADIAKVRQLLAEGAVPAAVRVAGFEPGGSKDVGNGMVLMSSGSPGHIVPAGQDGRTLGEYCRSNKLDAISDLLKSQDAE